MANKAALFNISAPIFIPGTSVLQSHFAPNSAVYRRLQPAVPFFGANSVSGSTTTTAVQLWPVKL